MGENSDINLSDEVDQKISLSDRFGILLVLSLGSGKYLLMVEKYLRKVDFDFNDSDWQNHAIQWQISRGSRSGRSACNLHVIILPKRKWIAKLYARLIC